MLDGDELLTIATRTLRNRVPIEQLDDAVGDALEQMIRRQVNDPTHAARIAKDVAWDARHTVDVDEQLDDQAPDPIDLADLAEQRDTIAQFVAWALSAPDSCVSLLSVVGFNDAEIATIIGRSRRTVLRSRAVPFVTPEAHSE